MNLLITLYQEAPNLERQLLAGTADITVFGVGEGECWWGQWLAVQPFMILLTRKSDGNSY